MNIISGIWPCISVVNKTRNEFFNQIHSVLDTVKYFNTIENFLQHLHNHPIDPHLIVIPNPENVEQLSKLIQPSVRKLFIYCSNNRLDEYDIWSKKHADIVSVLQHFHTLTQLILWELSACIVIIGENYDRENETTLAQTRYRYAYRLHVIIKKDLDKQREIIDHTQPTKFNN